MRNSLPILFVLSLCWTSAQPVPITLEQARQLALRSHPALQRAHALQSAAAEAPRQVRARMQPFAIASATAAGITSEDARLFAGGLNSPAVYDRVGTGVTVGQIITDFGRTRNLAASASLRAQAQAESTNSSRDQVLLGVDRSYFAALRAQAVLKVAEETVATRKVVADQAASLAASKLKSQLDVTFAMVNLEEARLLLSNAQNEARAAQADLGAALGSRSGDEYLLSDAPMPDELPPAGEGLVAKALAARPELQQARLEVSAAEKTVRAERDAFFPTVTAVANLGVATLHNDRFNGQWAAAGINMDIPLLNGGLLKSRRSEAEQRLVAAQQALRDSENRVARSVRVAYLGASNAFQRLQLTAQLLDQASQSLKLAQARYDLGLSSIVELTQAQLNVTRAQIAQASARYDYQDQRALLAYETGVIQ